MRFEAIDYYKERGYQIPDMIDRGKNPRYHVSQKQVESACEHIYLQLQNGLRVKKFDLGRYTLNYAKMLRVGHYYKVNLGDPVLLDDLTAIKTLESNLEKANIVNLDTGYKLFAWKLKFTLLSSGVIAAILNMVF